MKGLPDESDFLGRRTNGLRGEWRRWKLLVACVGKASGGDSGLEVSVLIEDGSSLGYHLHKFRGCSAAMQGRIQAGKCEARDALRTFQFVEKKKRSCLSPLRLLRPDSFLHHLHLILRS